ncbi:MAG: hypothetical protein IT374_00810 [Polyangiaceae bacterium]|nr:hypothetical protein [Polyangiaceae bacterium]
MRLVTALDAIRHHQARHVHWQCVQDRLKQMRSATEDRLQQVLMMLHSKAGTGKDPLSVCLASLDLEGEGWAVEDASPELTSDQRARHEHLERKVTAYLGTCLRNRATSEGRRASRGDHDVAEAAGAIDPAPDLGQVLEPLRACVRAGLERRAYRGMETWLTRFDELVRAKGGDMSMASITMRRLVADDPTFEPVGALAAPLLAESSPRPLREAARLLDPVALETWLRTATSEEGPHRAQAEALLARIGEALRCDAGKKARQRVDAEHTRLRKLILETAASQRRAGEIDASTEADLRRMVTDLLCQRRPRASVKGTDR